MDFVAVDVETANADCSTICQIGIVRFDEHGPTDRWAALIDPEDYFDGMNVSIHSITDEAVQGAPTFSDVYPEIATRLANRIVVHHMPFDRVALARAASRYALSPLEAEWLDSARVARRAWDRFSGRGYGLRNLAHELEIHLEHHDALSDAEACGLILRKAVEESGLTPRDWIERSRSPISGKASAVRTGDAEGPLLGERVVFTGKLSIPRREAADIAAKAGCDVATSVSQQVTLLVVGVQDLRRTKGRKKSSKHRKAERLIQEGCDIAIVGEEDFLELVGDPGGPDSA